jgi:hypothetical protein
MEIQPMDREAAFLFPSAGLNHEHLNRRLQDPSDIYGIGRERPRKSLVPLSGFEANWVLTK